MIVVSDTSVLSYLTQIDELHVLPALFGEVQIPPAVEHELLDCRAPSSHRSRLTPQPDWLRVRRDIVLASRPGETLQQGESEAIALASEVGADLLLLDDRMARRFALSAGLPITGTLGVLGMASRRHLLDIHEAVDRLQRTTFRASRALITELIGRSSG